MAPSEVIEVESAAVRMRARILDAATDLLSRLPLTKMTMEDVARTAGVARQTLYKHFRRKDELIVALFVTEMETTHHPALRMLATKRPTPGRLAEMFIVEFELASEYVLLSRTFDPAIAPQIAELVLGSPELLACREEIWSAILTRYIDAGVVRADLDLARTNRWMTYQHVWFLSHPEALTADAVERRWFVREFIVRPLLAIA